MADKEEENSAESLLRKYSRVQSEIIELEVMNSELETLRSNSKVYTKQRGGNVFFLSDRIGTTSHYKRILAMKMKEKEMIEQILYQGQYKQASTLQTDQCY